jgi:hypothetical protein
MMASLGLRRTYLGLPYLLAIPFTNKGERLLVKGISRLIKLMALAGACGSIKAAYQPEVYPSR